MFNRLRTKILNGISGAVSDVGPLAFFSQWFNPNNSVGELEQLEKYTGFVYTCVSAIAEDVAKIDFTLNRKTKDGSLTPVASHPFLDLLNNPNAQQGAYPFWELFQTHTELAGEAFIYVPKGEITGKPKELHIMRPDQVQIVYDQETGEVTGYVYHKYNGRVQVPLELDEVIHHKMANPINPYRGMGTVQAGILYIQTEEYASRYSRNFLANNATPAGILNLKGTIDSNEFNKIKRQWQREYGNVENAGKTAILRNADAEYVKVGSSFTDIDLSALKQMTRDDIMTMFRVSKPILGITEDVNYANARTAEYVFAKRVIDPKMGRIIDTLQSFYNLKYKDGLLLSYTSPIPQDNDEKIAYLTAAIGGSRQNGWITPNEVRTKEGLKPLAGGDELLVASTQVPLASMVSADTPTKLDQTKKKHIKLIPKKKAIPKLKDSQKEHFRLQLIHTANAYVPQFKHAINDAISKQKHAVLGQLDARQRKSKGLADDVDYGSDEVTNNIVELLTPVILELMKESGKYAMQLTGAEIDYILRQQSLDRVAARVQKVAAGFSEQTQAALESAIRDGIDNGKSLKEISDDVDSAFGDAMGYRSDRLARTETHHEANAATQDAYEQSGYVVSKEWYAGGDNPCEFCQELDGTVVSLEEVFVQKGDDVTTSDGSIYTADYGDVESGDLHPNCECTILPVTSVE